MSRALPATRRLVEATTPPSASTATSDVPLQHCFLVIALFITFGVLGTRAALRAPDRFGALIAAGVTMWVVGQAVINIGAVVGLLPVTGIPLPFVSFGGSALITTMLASGMLVNIARQLEDEHRCLFDLQVVPTVHELHRSAALTRPGEIIHACENPQVLQGLAARLSRGR